VEFKIDGVSVGTVAINASGIATVTTTIMKAPNPSYPVSAVFSSTNANYGGSNANKTIAVTQEDARIDYSGLLFVSTPSATATTASVTLRATISDITAISGDPDYDADAGDIRNARVAFMNKDGVTPTPVRGMHELDARPDRPSKLEGWNSQLHGDPHRRLRKRPERHLQHRNRCVELLLARMIQPTTHSSR
jgi:hypothetical protein